MDLCFIEEDYGRTCHLFPLLDYAKENIYEKCPAWTNNSHLKIALGHLKSGEIRNFVQFVDSLEFLESSLEEIIDHLIIDFGDYHQPVFDADRDGYSGNSDGKLRKSQIQKRYFRLLSLFLKTLTAYHRLKNSVKYLKIRIFLGLRGSYWRGKDCGPNDEVKGC